MQRFAVDRARAGAIIAAGLESPHPWLSAADAWRCSPPTVCRRWRADAAIPEEAIAFADEVGRPVVRVDDPGILHSLHVGGVQVNLRSRARSRARSGICASACRPAPATATCSGC
ncbi:MAG: hypothetical protein R3F43_19235 [bacterium]